MNPSDSGLCICGNCWQCGYIAPDGNSYPYDFSDEEAYDN